MAATTESLNKFFAQVDKDQNIYVDRLREVVAIPRYAETIDKKHTPALVLSLSPGPWERPSNINSMLSMVQCALQLLCFSHVVGI